MSTIYELAPRFQRLFQGLPGAHGTGKGQWIKRPASVDDWLNHLEGKGPGLGIAPLRPDDTVMFAAIDLDEPDFDAARSFQQWLPGASFIERSRSGNAHVWVFFAEPCPAWVATGMLRYAINAEGRERVEVFPKQTSMSHVTLGNYINLPYHGLSREVIKWANGGWYPFPLPAFLDAAEASLNSPADWRKRAQWLMIEDPALKRRDSAATEFGSSPNLHMCAEYVIEGALSGERPITPGHRSVVYFNLAKQLANCSMWSEAEAWDVLQQVADASEEAHPQPPKPRSELQRYLRNAYEKRYTSTGCDDPVFSPYADPRCPIANPRRTT